MRMTDAHVESSGWLCGSLRDVGGLAVDGGCESPKEQGAGVDWRGAPHRLGAALEREAQRC